MRLPTIALLAHAAWATVSPATANDSSASIAAGGLQLVANDSVRLVREDLTISVDQVVVRYLFRNVTDADFETLVAFPLPAVDLGSMHETDLGPIGANSINYIDFSVTVDGRPVVPEAESRATVGDRSVADRLGQFHLPHSGFDMSVFDTLESLPRYARTMLEAEGIARFGEYDGGVYAQPAWTFQTLYYGRSCSPPAPTRSSSTATARSSAQASLSRAMSRRFAPARTGGGTSSASTRRPWWRPNGWPPTTGTWLRATSTTS